MIVKTILKKETYYDSIVLLKISNKIAEINGVLEAAVMMATPTNKKLLENLSLLTSEVENASLTDLVIAVEAVSQEKMDIAISEIERLLSERESLGDEVFNPRTLDFALREMPDANLVLISVPGTFAARETSRALSKGLNVFLFSSNVPIAEELRLKTLAKDRGLLLMGPDCGTAIINNVVLGFGNKVSRGSIGLVSAAGTGLQQVSTLIDRQGLGISQAIGTGGNDLSKEVGGIMMMEGIKLLESDIDTEAIVLISKPPDSEVSNKVMDIVSQSSKPIVVNFIGRNITKNAGEQWVTATLEDAANKVCAMLRGEIYKGTIFSKTKSEINSLVKAESSCFSEEQVYVRGLFTGGTLCYEAMVILKSLIGDVYSNVPLTAGCMLEEIQKSKNHTCIDMGTEEFTIGRPHPMIDFTLRKKRIIQEAQDHTTAVLLLDVVLGFGAHHDPASELIPSITKAKKIAKENGGFLSVVASLVGTSKDNQDIEKQKQNLESAGVIIMPSNAQAARIAALIAKRRLIEDNTFHEGFDYE
ncbi:MAG: acyl-CoA synthetase FdrA [Candidatus Thorarchaeota archaeon]